MAQDYTKVAFGYGRAYIGAYVSGSPLTKPADTLARNGAWPGAWTDLGFTDGISYTPTPTSKKMTADQTTGTLLDVVTVQAYTFKLTLKQMNAANLSYIFGGMASLSNSGSSNILAMSHNARKTEYCIGIEGPSPDVDLTAAQRIFFLRCTVESIADVVFSKENETVADLTFNALVDVPTGEVFEVHTYEPTV